MNHPAFQGIEPISVSEFIGICNQIFSYNIPEITLQGEVASFKINQSKWVFFDLKDSQDLKSSVSCFLPLSALRTQLADGMKVALRAVPNITKWGKFSLTVREIIPLGEGSIKKSFELLKKQLAASALFDPSHKRPLPENLVNIGVISSTASAGYADFIKIINERWGGLNLQVAHTGVQGLSAADQIIHAIDYFNQQGKVEIIVIIRGGGSADDLAVFNDVPLVRAIFASRIPVLTGIGHEVDESLCDLVADLRASTPSNAAQMLTRDRRAEIAYLQDRSRRLSMHLSNQISLTLDHLSSSISSARRELLGKIDHQLTALHSTSKLLDQLNPERVLAQGYAIITGDYSVGSVVNITTSNSQITAEIKTIKERI